MNRCFVMRRVAAFLCTTGLIGFSQSALAAAFQLFEQDAVNTGHYHAGYAAQANDAATAWYNPAGITRFKNQQAVFAGNNILTDFKFRGTVAVNTLGNIPTPTTAQGGVYAFVPAMHYVAPIADNLGFGLSVVAPFGLKTQYGKQTALRYAATETAITVVDISPSLAYQYRDASFALGLDLQKVWAEFDGVAGIFLGGPDPAALDTTSTNKANGSAWGYHAGFLYEFSPCTRAGISYHSKVKHDLSGSSVFQGPLANITETNPSMQFRSRASTSLTLPAYTAVSVFHKPDPQIAVMASVVYTQWNVFKNLTLNNVSALDPETFEAATTTIESPQFYRNSWNVSFGGEYYPTDCITLRAGVGYDQTPIRNRYRTVRLPDADRYVVSVGGHYQASKCIGIDVGWLHVISDEVDINPPLQVLSTQTTSTVGYAKGGADVYGVQVTWDIT